MTLKSTLMAQFRKPSGLLGALAGRTMAARSSNRFRNARTVELLQLTRDSRVLEIGCGPGLALARCAQIVTAGRIVGLDHSGVMIR
jgi:ubiquinone/menaquinone biosynthesis C-methylase UbiE